MAKLEERAVDSGVASATALDDAALVEWWKKRFAMIGGVPTEIARAGAILPQMRQLSRLPDAQRRRLTKARMQAFLSLPSDQRQTILGARRLADGVDPDLARSDDAVADALAPEVPGAAELMRELGKR
jgi:putative intracellular protease/amidase